jgi:hypothetical protein
MTFMNVSDEATVTAASPARRVWTSRVLCIAYQDSTFSTSSVARINKAIRTAYGLGDSVLNSGTVTVKVAGLSPILDDAALEGGSGDGRWNQTTVVHLEPV